MTTPQALTLTANGITILFLIAGFFKLRDLETTYMDLFRLERMKADRLERELRAAQQRISALERRTMGR